MNKFNKFDYLVIVVITTIAFGLFLQPIKIIGLVSIPYVLCYSKKEYYKGFNQIKLFLMLFIIFNIISFLWSHDISLWKKDIVNVISLSFDFLLLVILSAKGKNPARAICYGWLFLIICTLPLAFWELSTGLHFTSQYETDLYIRGGVLLRQKFAAATLGNYNNYTTLLCVSLPFIASLIFGELKILTRLIILSIVISVSVVVILNSSRGGVVSLILEFTVFVCFYWKTYRKSIASILILVAVFLLALYYWENVIFQFEQRMIAKEKLFSDQYRSSLLLYGIMIFLDNPWGIGVGNIAYQYSKYPTHGLFIPHNLFMEFLLYGGIVFFSFFLYWLIKLYLGGIKNPIKWIRFLFYASGASLIPISVINSGYFLIPHIWLMFASLYIISNTKKIC